MEAQQQQGLPVPPMDPSQQPPAYGAPQSSEFYDPDEDGYERESKKEKNVLFHMITS